MRHRHEQAPPYCQQLRCSIAAGVTVLSASQFSSDLLACTSRFWRMLSENITEGSPSTESKIPMVERTATQNDRPCCTSDLFETLARSLLPLERGYFRVQVIARSQGPPDTQSRRVGSRGRKSRCRSGGHAAPAHARPHARVPGGRSTVPKIVVSKQPIG